MQQGLVFNEYKFNSERGGMTSGGADCAMGKALPQKMGDAENQSGSCVLSDVIDKRQS